ncbi:MAG TPA: glycosyltransferase family 2 protein, partial [Thermoleophilaceae bacterium]|nr:glycosyltransferase family 2 protein [Thermoleophilaceae bacterium]
GIPADSIVIVQNPTGPDDPAIAPPDPGVVVRRAERNLGYASGMNEGIRHQLERGVDWVLLLTHEIRFHPGSLQALLEAARHADGYGMIGPALWWQERDQPLSFGGKRGDLSGIHHLQERPHTPPNGIAACDWIDGAAQLIRAELLEQAGLLDERFFIYYEDVELCLRASRAGWLVGVVPQALADASPGAASRPGAYAYLTSRNGLEYARLAGGAKALTTRLMRQCEHSVNLLREYRRADEAGRARCRAALRGLWMGTLDFARRRWGPPPATLMGLGDLRNTQSS